MTPAVRVRGVSKQYRLGELRGYKTLRESLAGAFTWPGRRGNGNGGEELGSTGGANGDRIWALKDVSFDVEAGEVLGIIGANGAGKTTLLKILSRITEPTAGEVELFGRVSSLLEVGTGFHPELTGRENIFLNGSILGMRRREIAKKFDEIVDFSGVERFLDTPVKRYSSGMQVRLAFAVAAHLEPEILLVDEVLAVGDAEFQRKCLGKMGDIAGGGRTILFVSHNMAAVRNLCSSGIVLDGGQTLKIGPIDESIDSYLQESNGHDLPRRKGRYLDSIAIYSLCGDQRAVNSVPMGSGFILKATFRTPNPTKRPKFGVVLRRRSTGEPIFGVNTMQTGMCQLTTRAQSFNLSMTVEYLNLVPGYYTTDIYLGDEVKDFEVIHDAANLQISAADIYQTGKVPLHSTGPVFFLPKFSIVAE